MPETSRRVNVTFTFATDVDADHVMRQALESLPDVQAAALETVSVYEFDLDEREDAPDVHLVLDSTGGIVGTYIDIPERADDHARGIGGVVVALPVETDHREGHRG